MFGVTNKLLEAARLSQAGNAGAVGVARGKLLDLHASTCTGAFLLWVTYGMCGILFIYDGMMFITLVVQSY
jgi:hypothetical protein